MYIFKILNKSIYIYIYIYIYYKTLSNCFRENCFNVSKKYQKSIKKVVSKKIPIGHLIAGDLLDNT